MLFGISDTSKLMIKLECFLCVPNYWCAIAMVVHAWQHAQKCRMYAGTVVKNSCSIRFAVPCWWFHFVVPQVMRNEEGHRRSVQFIGHAKSHFFAF